MSLINDALRRAAADKPRDPHSPEVAPLQPVDPPRSGSSSVLSWALLLLGVGTVALAAALWFGGRSMPQPTASAPTPTANDAASGNIRNIAVALSPAPAGPTQSPHVSAQASQPSTKSVQLSPNQKPTTPAPVSTTFRPTELNKAVPPATATRSAAPIASAPTNRKAAALPSASPTKTPRLQSIFYRMNKPTVILNGKTAGVGDIVDGIKIVSIQRTSVEVFQNGKYRTLTLKD